MFDIRHLLLAGAVAFTLAACDNQRVAKLEEGVATEADVKREFGEPAVVYTEAGGARAWGGARSCAVCTSQRSAIRSLPAVATRCPSGLS